ncbi:hypothetical protein ATN88_09240 [Enterovibrio coralii]|uniref:Uncharacterized protein n=1 Tax=Enterovibrio coralii TaxID=294935 RepID=A0A135IA53_9GAMM|nr:hypothetical protein ATN88_09240 [Enterovibrio coralii]
MAARLQFGRRAMCVEILRVRQECHKEPAQWDETRDYVLKIAGIVWQCAHLAAQTPKSMFPLLPQSLLPLR